MKLENAFLQEETKTIYPTDMFPNLVDALRKSPWYAYTIEHRKEKLATPTTPGYHYSSAEPHFNDGTGLGFWNGMYHLFYGYKPFRESDEQHYLWGHCISHDLIHWNDLPPAIHNGPEPETWTGSILVEEKRVIGVYRAWKAGTGDLGIGIAISEDPYLLNWHKMHGPNGDGLVIKCDPNIPAFYTGDPCIWKHQGKYYILSGKVKYHPGSSQRMRQGYLFTSNDLENWEYIGPFIHDDMNSLFTDDLSCPTFWPIAEGERHLLTHFSHTYGATCILGDYHGTYFTPVSSTRLTQMGCKEGGGAGPTTTMPLNGDVILMHDLLESRSSVWYPPVFSLPQKITVSGKYRDEIAVSPAGDYASLRKNEVTVAQMECTSGKEIILEGFSGNQCETELTFTVPKDAKLEVRVLRSENAEEYTSIHFYPEMGPLYRQELSSYPSDGHTSVLCVNMDHSTLNDDVHIRAPESVNWFLRPEEQLKLHIFIDHNVLEIYANDKVYLCSRPMPSRKDSMMISILAKGNGVYLESGKFWDMETLAFPIFLSGESNSQNI